MSTNRPKKRPRTAPPSPERLPPIQVEVVEAIVDYLRQTAAGYAILRSVKADGARDALYSVALKLENDWESVVLPRLSRGKP